ncbi:MULTISPECIES: hypothetical protein [unclassified Isoptericola]|uniref:hypothetical protein n=1 Tax=unclassified Isoptericola TaxID=2623355 RepID=UPI003656C456
MVEDAPEVSAARWTLRWGGLVLFWTGLLAVTWQLGHRLPSWLGTSIGSVVVLGLLGTVGSLVEWLVRRRKARTARSRPASPSAEI